MRYDGVQPECGKHESSHAEGEERLSKERLDTQGYIVALTLALVSVVLLGAIEFAKSKRVRGMSL